MGCFSHPIETILVGVAADLSMADCQHLEPSSDVPVYGCVNVKRYIESMRRRLAAAADGFAADRVPPLGVLMPWSTWSPWPSIGNTSTGSPSCRLLVRDGSSRLSGTGSPGQQTDDYDQAWSGCSYHPVAWHHGLPDESTCCG